jgi:2-oxoglutarate ferredoxin oxidoreductase subunit beta
MDHLVDLVEEALRFRGFALVDVLQPCVAWNRINTYQFYNERVYKLGESGHDSTDLPAAYERAEEWSQRIPIGVFYKVERPTYGDNFPVLAGEPMVRKKLDGGNVAKLISEFA